MSYTSWKISGARLEDRTILADVVNTGTMDGDAVMQVYVRCDSPDAPTFPRLCGFTRVSVRAGETVTAAIPLDQLTDTVVNKEGERIPVQHMKFYVGMSQPDEKSVRLSGVLPVEIEM